jgi:hypothetical protein
MVYLPPTVPKKALNLAAWETNTKRLSGIINEHVSALLNKPANTSRSIQSVRKYTLAFLQ